jgi:hypothetical protein
MSEVNYNAEYYVQPTGFYYTKSTSQEEIVYKGLIERISDTWKSMRHFFSTSQLPIETWLFHPETADGREWKLDFVNKKEDCCVLEYTLPKENIHNWSELVTIQVFLNSSLTSKTYALSMMEGLRDSLSNGEEWGYEILSETPDSVVCEWYTRDKENSNHEYFKAIKTETAFYRFAYTTRKLDEVEQKLSVWETIIREISVVPKKNLPLDAQLLEPTLKN